METLKFTAIEREIIYLTAIKEHIDMMVNVSVLDLLGRDPNSEVKFKTMTHSQFFNILLVDFLSKSSEKVVGIKQTYLAAIKSICDNPCFDNNGSIENLKTSAKEFSDWLEKDVQVDIWMPSINEDAVLSLKRNEFIYICGNISKHSFTRLSGVATMHLTILRNNNIDIPFESALLVLDEFYERFHSIVVGYHGSTIAEFLNNIRWGIYNYLQPEFNRSIVWEDGIHLNIDILIQRT